MSQEIICIHVGHCGNALGLAFWDAIRKDHGLSVAGDVEGDPTYDELEALGTFFAPAGPTRYRPRAVVVDLAPDTLEMVGSHAIGPMFSSDDFVLGASSAGNNWGRGYYTDGAEIIDEVLDAIGQEVARCERLQGFMVFHGLGGGTGSGLGCLILERLAAVYPAQTRATVSVYSTPGVADAVVEPYNVAFSVRKLIDVADLSFVLDNEALANVARDLSGSSEPTRADLNEIAAVALRDATAPLRFPGDGHMSVRRMALDMTPLPRLPFVALSCSGAASSIFATPTPIAASTLIAGAVSSQYVLATVSAGGSEKHLAAALTICTADADDLAAVDVEVETARAAINPVAVCPWNLAVHTPSIPADVSPSVGFMVNTTGLKALYQRAAASVSKLYKRRAFVEWYEAEGMSPSEFELAIDSLVDLVSRYADVEDLQLDEEE